MTRSSSQHGLRIGLDLGGSKIGGVPVGRGAKKWARYRVDATRRLRGYYRGHCRSHSQAHAGHRAWREDRYRRPRVYLAPNWPDAECQFNLAQRVRAFDRDLALALATPVRLANDANCFALEPYPNQPVTEMLDLGYAGAQVAQLKYEGQCPLWVISGPQKPACDCPPCGISGRLPSPGFGH